MSSTDGEGEEERPTSKRLLVNSAVSSASWRPSSLQDYASKKSHLSVTDLVSPSWCEYLFQYRTLGLAHLPIAQRPEKVITPQGALLVPDLAIVQQQEVTLASGKATHKALEDEAHPVRTEIRTTTEEDRWALRLLRLMTGLQALMDHGCCREVPVMGIVHGKLVLGVVDELLLRPLDKKKGSNRRETPTKEASQPAKKRWASQDAWKRDSSSRGGPSSYSTPSSSANKRTKLTSSRSSIESFFGAARGQSEITRASKSHEEQDANTGLEDRNVYQTSLGIFLSDAKTRSALILPTLDDQQHCRLQCMLYKRLLDGLFAGAWQDLRIDNERDIPCFDRFATPFTPKTLIAILSLRGDALLSKNFLSDAATVDFPSKYRMGSRHTLEDFGKVLTELLCDVADFARRHCCEDSMSTYSVLQDDLSLVYLRRAVGGLSRQGRSSQSKSDLDGEKKISYQRMHQIGRQQEKQSRKNADQKVLLGQLPYHHTKTFDSGEEARKVLASYGSMDVIVEKVRSVEREDDLENPKFASDASDAEKSILVDAKGSTILEGQSGMNTMLSKKAEQQKDEVGMIKESTIGTAHFQHEPEKLEMHLVDILSMWAGRRPLKGVEPQNTNRCYSCEFLEGCEWRRAKGQERLMQYYGEGKWQSKPSSSDDSSEKERRQEFEVKTEELLWSQVADLPEDLQW